MEVRSINFLTAFSLIHRTRWHGIDYVLRFTMLLHVYTSYSHTHTRTHGVFGCVLWSESLLLKI